MIQEVRDELWLKEYAKNNSIYDLSGEDIIKLMMIPYLREEIAEAFGISVKELDKIRKQKGVANIYLEDAVRNIETILNYIDSKPRFVSNTIRKKLVDSLIPALTNSIPKGEFYREELRSIDFSRKKVLQDLSDKEIDKEYRLNLLNPIISDIDNIVDILVKEEKDYFLNYNNHKLYKELEERKENGEVFSREDLTYDVLFELSVIENMSDSSIGLIYNLRKGQVRYLREKYELINISQIKLAKYPEIVMYFAEEKNQRPEGISNYDYEEVINNIVKGFSKKEEQYIEENNDSESYVIINVNGEDIVYHVNFSDEKYSVNTKHSNKKSNGSHRNQKKESETKRTHGKIGEQLALAAEKKRLIGLGLEDLIGEVKLIAQIDEDTTLDGLGYDLVSFNEFREPICIEVKTSYGSKDKPFFISKKEIDILKGIKSEYDCKHALIYYVLVDGCNVTIKNITPYDLSKIKLETFLYKVG